MTESRREHEAILALLQTYFDGLYFSDTARLREVFHPQALYCNATADPMRILHMPEYFAIVDQRESPSSRGEARHDEVVCIDRLTPALAQATVRCAIGSTHYTDLLSLVQQDGLWRIMAKVFDAQTSA